jgi:hypothetical protein
MSGRMACAFIQSGSAGPLSTSIILIHGSPSAPFGLLFRDTASFIAFLNMFSLALLLVCIFSFVTSGHIFLPSATKGRPIVRGPFQPSFYI